MAKYTQEDADNMIDNTSEDPGKGWKESEVFCDGCNETNPAGQPVVVGRGWRYDMWNKDGRPLEILVGLEDDVSEPVRHKAAKDKIKTLDIIDCDIYPPA